MLIAIPEFNGCVSPTFDFCHRVALWRLDRKGLRRAGERRCESLGPTERSSRLQAMGVEVLLCGAIGKELAMDIGGRGIEVVHGLSGDVSEIVAAFASGTLDHPKFRMPGAPPLKGKRGGRREVEP